MAMINKLIIFIIFLKSIIDLLIKISIYKKDFSIYFHIYIKFQNIMYYK